MLIRGYSGKYRRKHFSGPEETIDRLLSAQEVAEYLGVELDTLYRYARSGRIGGVKVGKYWRFTQADVEAFVRGGRRATAAPATLPEVLRTVAKASDQSGRVVAGDMRASWAEIDALSDRLAMALLQRGVAPGDRVLTVLGNSVQFIIACFAVWKARAVLVPEYTAIRPNGLRHILADADPAIMIVDRGFAERLDDGGVGLNHVHTVFVRERTFTLSGLEHVTVESLDAVLESPTRGAQIPRSAPPAEIVSITYTSGSTGAPKGVMHTHQSWLAGAAFTKTYLGLSERDTIVIPLPLHHGLAFRQILAYLLANANVVITSDIYQALRALKQERPTALLLVPAACNIAADNFASVVQQADPHLRYVEIGSAAMTPERLRGIRELLPSTTIHLSYGLTEARVGYLREGSDGKLNRIAAVPDGLSVCVVDDDGKSVGIGKAGEILLQGTGLMHGYWEKTESKRSFLEERGFPTGDAGRLNQQGDVELLGRLDEVLKVGGKKVNPLEIELLLNQHPGVDESAVLGAPDPAGVFESVLHAFVVLRKGESISASDLEAHCRRNLEPYKVPRRFHFRSSLPKSPIGKVRRQALEIEDVVGAGVS